MPRCDIDVYECGALGTLEYRNTAREKVDAQVNTVTSGNMHRHHIIIIFSVSQVKRNIFVGSEIITFSLHYIHRT